MHNPSRNCREDRWCRGCGQCPCWNGDCQRLTNGEERRKQKQEKGKAAGPIVWRQTSESAKSSRILHTRRDDCLSLCLAECRHG